MKLIFAIALDAINKNKDKDGIIRKSALEVLTQIAIHLRSYKLCNYFGIVFESLIGILDNRNNEATIVLDRALSTFELYFDIIGEYLTDNSGGTNLHKQLEEMADKYLSKSMKIIVEKCIGDVDHSLQCQALAAIASIARTVEKKFEPYLEGMMKLLAEVISKENQNLQLRCEAFVALGTIAQAVGFALYEPYFARFHDITVKLIQQQPLQQAQQAQQQGKELEMNNTNELATDNTFREAICLYFSQIVRMLGPHFVKLASFDDVLTFILRVIEDDTGMNIQMPDDGFGDDFVNTLGLSQQRHHNDNDDQAKEENNGRNNDEMVNIEDLANMAEPELAEYLQQLKLAPGNENANANENENGDEIGDYDEEELYNQKIGQLKNLRISIAPNFMEAKAAAIHCLSSLVQNSDPSVMILYFQTLFDNFVSLWDLPNVLVKMAVVDGINSLFTLLLAHAHNEKKQKNRFNFNRNQNDNNNNKDEKPKRIGIQWKVGVYNHFEKKVLYNSYVAEFIECMYPCYISSILEETEHDVLWTVLYNFVGQLKGFGPASVHDYLPQLLDAIVKFLNRETALFQTDDMYDNMDEIAGDGEQLGDYISKYETVLDSMSELIAALALLYNGEQYLKFIWGKIFGVLKDNYTSLNSKMNDAITLGCIANVCENIADTNGSKNVKNNDLMKDYTNESFEWLLTLLEGEIEYITEDLTLNEELTDDSNVNLIQNGLYCMGALFMVCNSKETSTKYIEMCLNYLLVFIRFDDNGTRNDQLIRDNAVSALGKLIVSEIELLKKIANDSEDERLKLANLIEEFVNHLPLTADFVENNYVYKAVIKLIDWNEENVIVLNQDMVKSTLLVLLAFLKDENADQGLTDIISTRLKVYCQTPKIQRLVGQLDQQIQQHVHGIVHLYQG